MDPRQTLDAFDTFLTARQMRFDGIVIGGAALNLLGVVSRVTKDCDVLDPEIPEAVATAARAFAAVVRAGGGVLEDSWFNNGPRSLVRDLPPGWRDRLQPLLEGSSLLLRTLGREDLLRAKLFALCDRAIDLPDCLALGPTAEELRLLRPWLAERDGNPLWPAHVEATLADLAARLRHGF